MLFTSSTYIRQYTKNFANSVRQRVMSCPVSRRDAQFSPAGPVLAVFSQHRLPLPSGRGFARAKTFALAGFFTKAGEPCPQKFSYVLFENSQATRWFNKE